MGSSPNFRGRLSKDGGYAAHKKYGMHTLYENAHTPTDSGEGMHGESNFCPDSRQDAEGLPQLSRTMVVTTIPALFSLPTLVLMTPRSEPVTEV